MTARYPIERAHRFIAEVLTAQDVLPEHAEITAARMLDGDLRGRTGHGIIRLPLYSSRIAAGGTNLRPDIRLLHETPVSALVDGDDGLGHPAVELASDTAMAKAEETGMAWVGTRNSNHAGAAGVWVDRAVRRGLIAIYMAVANANGMPPWGGKERLLGTNPISVGIPTSERPPFLLDIATTVASHGTIKVAAQRGETMPVGWVVDTDGNPITDPNLADDGFLVPIGGYKGSGLNIVIGMLSGVLNGAAFARDVVNFREELGTNTNTGQSIFVMRPDLFGDRSTILAEFDRQLSELANSESIDGGPIRLPGDQVERVMAQVRADGVEVPEALHAQLDGLADRYGVERL
jgi:LDH2 family malate/lactate/ureidoglycolate dehydrogenase